MMLLNTIQSTPYFLLHLPGKLLLNNLLLMQLLLLLSKYAMIRM